MIWEIIIFVIRTVLSVLIITTIINMILMGILHLNFQKSLKNKDYMIKCSNRFEYQGECECGAFSSAYLLRHLGKNKKGFGVYEEIPSRFKMRDGAIYPKGVRHYLKENGVSITYSIGNLTALKNEVSKGKPVIVLLKTIKDKNWLHYTSIVGYDEEYIFFAESYKPLVNEAERYYNRRVKTAEFLKLWNTSQLKMPLYRNTFFTVNL